ncbi:NADH-dependent flavin oxidoreductase [Enterococcus sp. LJL120]
MTKINQPVTLKNGVTLRNPLMMAPMTTQMSFFNGVITQDEITYYQNRSQAIGAVITGAANVQVVGQGWAGELGVYDDKFIPNLTKLATAIKAGGAKAILQIFHGGRMSPKNILNGAEPVSASAVAAERPGAPTPRALTGEEVLQVMADFKAATKRAVAAGFDGVEIHGANTYLIQQFFSPHSNRREDEWGGSLVRRFHFIDILVDEILAAGKEKSTDFIVGYRFSPEEYETPGIRMEDTLYLVDQLAEKNLDYLHVSLNEYQRVSVQKEFQEKSIVDYLQGKIAGRVPLVAVGGIEEAADVEALLNHADLAAVGQALIIDPDWGEKVLNQQPVHRVSDLDSASRTLRGTSLWDFVNTIRLDK